MEKIPESIVVEQMKLLERLSEKYHLTEHQGRVCLSWNGFEIYFLNFAIKEVYLMFIPVYIVLRTKIEKLLMEMFSPESDKELAIRLDKELSPTIAKLFFLGIDKDKTDFDILMRKMNLESKNLDHATFILDLVQAFDYAVFRGQQLIMMLDDVLESGDIKRAKELDDKNILPYKLIPASSEEEMKEKIKEFESQGHEFVEESPMYDLKNMRVIGEA